MSRTAVHALLASLRRALQPLIDASTDFDAIQAAIEEAGWDSTLMPNVDALPGASEWDSVNQAVDALKIGERQDVPSLASFLDLLELAAKMPGALEQIGAIAVSGVQGSALDFVGDMLETRMIQELERVASPATRALTLLGVIYTSEPTEAGGPRGRLPRAQFSAENLSALLEDPTAYLGARYSTFAADGEVAKDLSTLVLPAIRDLLRTLGLLVRDGADPQFELELPADEADLAEYLLRLELPFDDADFALTIGLAVDDGDLTLLILPTGRLRVDAAWNGWSTRIDCELEPGGVAVNRRGLQAAPGGARATVRGSLAAPPDPLVLLGGSRGTGFVVTGLQLSVEAQMDTEGVAYGVALGFESARIALAGSDGDGFLSSVLPTETDAEFRFGLGWSNRRGLYLANGSGLDVSVPVQETVAGVVSIESVDLALAPGDGRIDAVIGLTVTVALGPVRASVRRVGLQASITTPRGGGNLGLGNVDVLFKPPSGIGLTIDSGTVTGGGFLFFDEAEQRYGGAVHLELAETLRLTAYGLITTRMPDGKPGFSLLVVVSAEFSPPIQLGYGFALSGVGGLVAVNRTVAVDVLRGGLRTGTLGSVLFPQDPIRNAPQIVSDLGAIFPPAPDRFLFGPVLKLEWGTPKLLTVELGLILELPAPVRLIVLGRLRIVLPDEKAPIVRLQLDALGIIDFASGDLSLDASLYESRIAEFAVTGEMALRANWGAKPGFVLAIGGFNPRFPAPTGFPLLERVAISLATGDNPRLRLEAYFALTTNTVQFGARLDLYAEAGPFSIDGYLGFDALLQFSPFGFVVDLAAGVALKYEGRSVLAIALSMTLSGPTPWYARGRASFTLLFISASVSFEIQFGHPEPPPLPPPVQIRPLLLAALRERGNWKTQVTSGTHPIVSLREQPGSVELLVHPLAELEVTQRIVPLDEEITRFGNTVPDGERRFTLGLVDPDGTVRVKPEEGIDVVTDDFAPAQFRDMSDDEKLAAPAFERLPAGVRFASQTYTCGTAVIEPEIAYETRYLPDLADTAEPMKFDVMREPAVNGAVARAAGPSYSVPLAFFEQVAAVGAAARAPLRRTGKARYRGKRRQLMLRPRSRRRRRRK